MLIVLYDGDNKTGRRAGADGWTEMKQEIRAFLDRADRTVVERGLQYCRSGRVRGLTHEGDRYTARVDGSCYSHYDVTLRLGPDGTPKELGCTCLYDRGPVCKHEAAALLTILWGEGEALGPSLEERLEQMRAQLETAERWYEERGFLCWEHCDSLSRALDRALDGAEEAGSILAVLRAGLRACRLADERRFAQVADRALDMLELQGAGMEGTVTGAKLSSLLLETARSEELQPWESWRCRVLDLASRLADGTTASPLAEFLDGELADLAIPAAREQNRVARYHLVAAAYGPEASRAFLEHSLDVEPLRVLAVEQALDGGDFPWAEQLCLGAEDSILWKQLRYRLYESWGRRDRQLAVAEALLLDGQEEYYPIIRELMEAEGSWETGRNKLLLLLRDRGPVQTYLNILRAEGKYGLMLEAVKQHKGTLLLYGADLAPHCPEKLWQLVREELWDRARHSRDRKEYRDLGRDILKAASWGFVPQAGALVGELADNWPRRPALQEELARTRVALQELK